MNKISFFELNRRKIKNIFIFILLSTVLFIGIYLFNNMNDKANSISESILREDKLEDINLSNVEKIDSEVKDTKKIKVDVKGYVKSPGVYELSSDKRVVDAITMAGGLLKNADSSVINLSKKLIDEMVIVVYSKENVENFKDIKNDETNIEEKCINNEEKIKNDACIAKENNDKNQTLKVNINTASIEELMTLSGIGESKANSIIEYRNKNGKFKKIEDIQNVTGIGISVFEKIKDNITV